MPPPPPKGWRGGGILVSVRIPLSARQILVPMITLEPVDGISPKMPGYIILTSIGVDEVDLRIKVVNSCTHDIS